MNVIACRRAGQQALDIGKGLPFCVMRTANTEWWAEDISRRENALSRLLRIYPGSPQ
jgi:hypothetical protein